MSEWDDQSTAILPNLDERGSIDVVYRRESGSEAMADGVWRAFDICTRNRIYGLDIGGVCVAVIDRATGQLNETHSYLNAQLVGGQRIGPSGTHISYPLPEAGMVAVFNVRKKNGASKGFAQTSAVTRVIVRQRVVHIAPGQQMPDWDDISGRRKFSKTLIG